MTDRKPAEWATWTRVWATMEHIYPQQTKLAKEMGQNQVMFFTSICVRLFVDNFPNETPEIKYLRDSYRELEACGYLNK